MKKNIILNSPWQIINLLFVAAIFISSPHIFISLTIFHRGHRLSRQATLPLPSLPQCAWHNVKIIPLLVIGERVPFFRSEDAFNLSIYCYTASRESRDIKWFIFWMTFDERVTRVIKSEEKNLSIESKALLVIVSNLLNMNFLGKASIFLFAVSWNFPVGLLEKWLIWYARQIF